MTHLTSEEKANLLSRIIDKGGLIADIARICSEDEEQADAFLTECFEQARSQALWKFWGKDLVADLVSYHVKNLSFQYRQLFGRG